MEVDCPDVAGLYRRFAEIEARGSSPTYERLCLAIADHEGMLSFLATLPRGKRQPNLLLGALRLLGADVGEPTAALRFAVEHTEVLGEVMLSRSTQTNEPARCAVLLPALALLPEPVALLEVGASAGLCLRYEAYRYLYRDTVRGEVSVGEGDVTIRCDTVGVPIPEHVPSLAARLGLDANPLDAADPDVAAWLRCLVWPEHTERATRLDRALSLAAADPAPLVRGLAPRDVPAALARLRALAPDATPVVVHSATAAYLDPEERSVLGEVCRDEDALRVGLEGAQVSADLGVTGARRLAETLAGRFVLSLDSDVLGHADPHGRDLVWC